MVALNALFAAAAAAAAAQSQYGGSNVVQDWSQKGNANGVANCDISTFVPQFPSGQTQLVAPASGAKFIGLAFGVQNYTCSTSNTYTSVGAVAELIDVSCHVNDPGFSTIQQGLFDVWTTLIPSSIQSIIDFLHVVNPPQILAQHYFVPNPVTGQGLSPKWDFTSSGKFQGNKEAFIVAGPKGNIPAPDDPAKNIAWLDVVNIQGSIADEVFRFDTVGGQPPTSCTSGQSPDISVKYTSKYIFYGGKIN